MKDKESKSFSKQIKRYAKVGGVIGTLATKLASQKYLGVKLDKRKHASEVRSALGNIKGPLMKVAQLSATIPDLLPPEYAQELTHLQSNAPPMGWLFVKRRMAAELSFNWQKNFNEFDKEATRAASLGQVHKAKLLSGKEVACKSQYPLKSLALCTCPKEAALVASLSNSLKFFCQLKLNSAAILLLTNSHPIGGAFD
jgi:predicted unusual protein kinase regulating ubiquinone biosynthesis (AarF/ABC1/UbiB family)